LDKGTRLSILSFLFKSITTRQSKPHTCNQFFWPILSTLHFLAS
jgi:hypothetical protein